VTDWQAHAVYALAWLSFGLGHSLLAGETAKQLLRPHFGAAVRVVYNVIAVVHLALVAAIGHWAFATTPPWSLPPAVRAAGIAVTVVGVVLLLVAGRGYDLGRLSGVHQLRAARRGLDEAEDEPLRTDGLHRLVRHPLYSAAFLVLWGLVEDHQSLATAVWGSVYLVIGTWAEERRLLRRYGQAYADYRRRVPAFVPWIGRAIG
jgi:protein-S-isoprenylcysteine O-methyltransferase Ste14